MVKCDKGKPVLFRIIFTAGKKMIIDRMYSNNCILVRGIKYNI